MKFGPEYPELLADLALQLHELLVQNGIDAGHAEDLARKHAEGVRQRWGGQLVYVPTGMGHELMQRWQEIWDKFKGDNIAELAREYGYSEMTIYRIIKRKREAETRRLHGDMFPAANTKV